MTPEDPTPPPSKLRARKRRADLLKAARKIFARDGYEAATVQAIVKEAGVAQGTFYLYFPSKREALAALKADLYARIASAVAAVVAEETTVAERVRQGVSMAFALAYRHRDVLPVIRGLERAALEPDPLAPLLEPLAAALEAEAAKGAIRCPDATATAMMMAVLVEQMAYSSLIAELPRSPMATEEALVAFLLSALGLSPE